MITRDECADLDAADPLAPVRGRFLLPDGLIYLDGNSLGALPRHVPERVGQVIERQWGHDLIGAWNLHGWLDMPFRVGERLARILGAEPGSVVACDSTSINLFKVVEGALGLMAGRRVILTDTANFPTDLYVLQGVAGRRGLEVRTVEPDAVEEAIDETVAVVALTQVDYRSGRLHDLAAVTAAAHRAGALAVWDLAHSAGAMPLDLAGAGADFAVGCGYKYLNGGPGAPAFAYVAPRHQDTVLNPVPGWFGHRAPFSFDPTFSPAAGIGRMQVGTPPILSLAALDAALELFDELDLGQVRTTSLDLTGLFVDLLDERCGGHGIDVLTPRVAERRGSQVAFRHPHAHELVQALIAVGVVGDFRAPDVARFGMAAPYVRRVDVWDAVDRLAGILESGSWRDPRFAVRAAVT